MDEDHLKARIAVLEETVQLLAGAVLTDEQFERLRKGLRSTPTMTDEGRAYSSLMVKKIEAQRSS